MPQLKTKNSKNWKSYIVIFFRNWRVYLVFFLIVLIFTAVIYQLFFLQVKNYKLYQARALGQQINLEDTKGERGRIFWQNSQKSRGEEFSDQVQSVAINKDEWIISANATLIEDPAVFSASLSKLTGLQEEKIMSLLNSDNAYVVLKKGVSTEELEKIKSNNFKNIWWQKTPVRLYPQGSSASQTIGFLGGEGRGQYGIEGYYEEMLKGKTGINKRSKGLESLFEISSNQSLNGADIYLTVDYNIQFQAETLLKEAEEKFGIISGQIIVMKPDSGKIIALANYPSFDLNNYSKEFNLEIFQNGATQKLFEPGSIMKPFTMAIALNEGKITPDTKYTDTGSMKFGIYTISNFNKKIYGEQTMTQVLESSINTGAVFASQQFSHKTYLDYIKKFGFTDKTDIDLQGEVYSRNESLSINAPDINFATASFGQGIEATPIQVASAFCAIANGGKLVKPYIVEKVVDGGKEIITETELSKPIISQNALDDLRGMLISVVDNGFNGTSKIPGYYIAGKTGTAQIPLKNGRGYESEDKTIQSFIGYGPAYNPEFLIMVKLDQPKVASSSLSAVPIFKELAEYIINYWQIPPDYEEE